VSPSDGPSFDSLREQPERQNPMYRRLSRRDLLIAVTPALAALAVGATRAIHQPIEQVAVLAVLGFIILWAALLTIGVASGRVAQDSMLLLAALVIPLATRGILSSIGYPGTAHLSAADIQFLRATQWVSAGLPLGAGDARLTLYPTSFAGLAGVQATTGVTVETLLPLWAYVMIRRHRDRSRRPVLLSLLLLTVMISTHFFSALFLVLVGFAIGASAQLFDAAGPRPIRQRLVDALRSGLRACLLPVATVAAWLTYIAGRYLAESEGLIRAFLSSLAGPSAGGTSLASVLTAWQLIALVAAAAAFALIAGVAVVSWIQFRDRIMGSSVVLALFAVPLVAWAVLTPLQFAGGTDLKEWKVRPLAAAFLLCAPVVGLALREILSRWRSALAYPVVLVASAAIFTNSLTLWFSYGALGPAVLSASATPAVVEDTGVTPDEYRLLGNFVRTSVSHDRYLLADWHQLTWMVGAGGLRLTPDYQTAAFVDPALTLGLSRRYFGIAVDRNLLRYPSVYITEPADGAAMSALANDGLDRVFDSGSQVLYVSTSPPS
jgi:hypothetical protein